MIRILTPEDLEAHLGSLVAILQDTVDHGASVGFLPPLPAETAAAYWRGLLPEIAAGSRTLLAALDGAGVLGIVQIAWAAKENARHRREPRVAFRAVRRQGSLLSDLRLGIILNVRRDP